MKLYGDVPESHKQLVINLEDMEVHLDDKNHVFTSLDKAKAFTCLAHDWYMVGLEEEGSRLLKKAEEVSPGYFDKVVKEDMEKDENFDILVKRIASQLIFMLQSKEKRF